MFLLAASPINADFLRPPHAPPLASIPEMLAYLAFALVISLAGNAWIIGRKSQIGLDAPDGRRKQHAKPIPRLGGVPIFLALSLGMAVLVWMGKVRFDVWKPILITNALMFSVGFLDDLKPLGARVKLIGQVGTALVLYSMDVSIDMLTNPFGEGHITLGLWSLPLTVFWLVAIPNILNLIDGMDGLAGGFGMFLSLTLAFVGYVALQPELMIIAIVMAGALMGFLWFNLPPAKIFLGDGGAYLIGFFVASMSLHGSNKGSVIAALLVIIIALGVPILDTLFAILRRSMRGMPIFSADAEHIHHRLILLGYSKGRALVAMYSVCAVLSIVGISILLTKGIALPIAGAVLFLLAISAARYLGYVRSWKNLRHQVAEALARRRRLEHIRAHARTLEFDIENCVSLEEFTTLMRTRLSWIGFHELASAASQPVFLKLRKNVGAVFRCPREGLEVDWFNRVDAFSSLLERCLERWEAIPEFMLPTEVDYDYMLAKTAVVPKAPGTTKLVNS